MKREKEILLRRLYPFGVLGSDTRMESGKGCFGNIADWGIQGDVAVAVRPSRQCSGGK